MKRGAWSAPGLQGQKRHSHVLRPEAIECVDVGLFGRKAVDRVVRDGVVLGQVRAAQQPVHCVCAHLRGAGGCGAGGCGGGGMRSVFHG